MDAERVQGAVRELLAALGEDADRPELRDTPARTAGSWEELLAGRDADARIPLTPLPHVESFAGEVVALHDISFRSVCEHHLLPFDGLIHVQYRSSGPVAGLSSFVRTIEILSSRLQLQERLTQQIADTISEALDADGVIVAIVARHGCVSDRGVRQSTARTTTIAARGSYGGANEDAAAAALFASRSIRTHQE